MGDDGWMPLTLPSPETILEIKHNNESKIYDTYSRTAEAEYNIDISEICKISKYSQLSTAVLQSPISSITNKMRPKPCRKRYQVSKPFSCYDEKQNLSTESSKQVPRSNEGSQSSLPDYEDQKLLLHNKPPHQLGKDNGVLSSLLPESEEKEAPSSTNIRETLPNVSQLVNPTLFPNKRSQQRLVRPPQRSSPITGGVKPSDPAPTVDPFELKEVQERKQAWNTEQAEKEGVSQVLESVRDDIAEAKRKIARQMEVAQRGITGGIKPSDPAPEIDFSALRGAQAKKKQRNTKQAEKEGVAHLLEDVRAEIAKAKRKNAQRYNTRARGKVQKNRTDMREERGADDVDNADVMVLKKINNEISTMKQRPEMDKDKGGKVALRMLEELKGEIETFNTISDGKRKRRRTW